MSDRNRAKAYENKKLYQQAIAKAQSEIGRDIGQIPPIVNPKRRKKADGSLLYFLTTYFAAKFFSRFSDDHKRLIQHLEHIIIHGGQKAFAMPRGSGKSTISECSVLWSILTGRRHFVLLVGQSKEMALKMMESIKSELTENELLLEDYPEACFPIRALEGVSNRTNGQLQSGERTQIKWQADRIILPTIRLRNNPSPKPAYTKSSGAMLMVKGMTSAMRGLAHTHNGKKLRPDLAVVDDPQTDSSARNKKQIERRMQILFGTILGLSGHGSKLATFVPCTIIEHEDLAAQILDRSLHPEFEGETTKLIYEWPTSTDLWEQYADLRRTEHGNNHEGSTKHYVKNRKAMDFGSKVGWADRKYPHEISALQHAMNLKIDFPLIFDAEYQNEPKIPGGANNAVIKSTVLAQKMNGLDRWVVPEAADLITAFVDVQQDVLYYAVMAWSKDWFTGTIIDYGTYPDQKMGYFSLQDLRHKLKHKYPMAGIEGAIRSGLDDLTKLLNEREYLTEDGIPLRICRQFVDSGNWAKDVYQFCRESRYANILFPTKGAGITASACPISNYKNYHQIGTEWYTHRPNKRSNLLLTFDTNYWKSFCHRGFNLAHGDKGSISLFGKQGQDHKMISDHLTAEYKVPTSGRGRDVDEWKLIDRNRDNHILDCVVGCAVAADVAGCRTTPISRPAKSTAQGPRIIKSIPIKC